MMATIHRPDWHQVPSTDKVVTDLELEGDQIMAEALDLADAGDIDQAERRAEAAAKVYFEAETIRRSTR